MSENENSDCEEKLCLTDIKSKDAAASSVLSEKQRRVHMDLLACFKHASTSEGKKPLASPDLGCASVDVNKGLYPVIRNRKRKFESDRVENGMPAFPPPKLTLSQGFVSASDMYNISKQDSDSKVLAKAAGYNTKILEATHTGKKAKQTKQIHNQGSILSFVSVKSSTVSKVEKELPPTADHEDEDLLNKPHTTLMFSPIKKLGKESDSSCIYISDSSPASSPSSSVGSQPNYQPDRLKEHPVVKKLFDAQKMTNQNSKGMGKGRKPKPKQSPFVNRTEKEKIKVEATKFFEGDSLDMDKVFDSDLDDNYVVTRGAADKRGSQSHDKYGLLGSGSYPKEDTEKVNYFEWLPLEVIENIFCQLPLLDLCLNINRVCLQWNDIIADEKVCFVHSAFSK